MNKTDISEIFALFRIAFPTAAAFNGPSSFEQETTISALISLWERSTQQIDRWLGLSAAEYIVQHNKFFPSIAEFIEAAASVEGLVSGEIAEAFSYLKSLYSFFLFEIYSEEQLMQSLPKRTLRVLKAMGGLTAFYDGRRYNYSDFFRIYNDMLRTNSCYMPPVLKTMNAAAQIEGPVTE